jgi:hypothetical protein
MGSLPVQHHVWHQHDAGACISHGHTVWAGEAAVWAYLGSCLVDQLLFMWVWLLPEPCRQ